MEHRLTTGLSSFVLLFFVGSLPTIGAESMTAIDLISADVAFCLEVPHLNESWAKVESGPLMERLREFPPFQRLIENQNFRHWLGVDDHVARQTGKKLSQQLRSLFGRSLVLAVYVPLNGKPRGILIGEALDVASVEMAVATWNKMEPNEVTSVKTHQGHRYQQRRKHANSAENSYFVTSDRWFAITDQESLIQEVIDRFREAKAATSSGPSAGSLRGSQLYQRNRQRLKPNADAYVYIGPRPWDRGLEESSKDDLGPINPAIIWRHVNAVSAGFDIDAGVVCDAVIELETTRLPSGWSQFVGIAATTSNLSRRVPADALLAVSGHLDISPFIRLFVSQIPQRDQLEFTKIRRVAQSVLGGQESLDVVLPTLAHNFCGCVTTRIDTRTKRAAIDGMLVFALISSSDAKIVTDVAQGMRTALSCVAAYFSAEGKNVVTVKNDQWDSSRLSWLSENSPISVALGEKKHSIVIAGSEERLRKTLEWLENGEDRSRLADHSRRFFPDANQLVWFDVAKTREILKSSGGDLAQSITRNSSSEASRLASGFEQLRPLMGVVDSLFVAGRFESDHIRITLGAGLDLSSSLK